MSLFGNTVAGITRGLNDMVKELDRHAKLMLAKRQKHEDRANAELLRAREAQVEAEKADKIAAKIGDLLK